MASSSRTKSKSTTSSGSFFDLKAELAKKEDEFSKAKAAGKARTAIVGGVQRPEKKPTIWARQNKGIKSRNARDVELEAVSKPTLENARAALERKAAIYDKLKKGKTGGLSDKQYATLLVDFDQKDAEASEEDDSDDEEDEDESLTVPGPSTGNDPLVEYEDEFGRMRTVKKSEVPRHLAHPPEEESQREEDPYLIHGDTGYFPVFEPSAERIREIEESAKETHPAAHYDASYENRAKGAGFYQFSADEETRQREMEELKRTRDETQATRVELEKEPELPEADLGKGKAKFAGRAMEKRKRAMEERRLAIQSKRQKPSGAETTASTTPTTVATADPPPPASTISADDFLATLEEDWKHAKG